MTLDLLYHSVSSDTLDGEKARRLLMQTHWYSTVADFDPRTAEALPQPLSKFLQKNKNIQSDIIKDRLWRITEHARVSLEKLLRNLNESSCREQAILPLRSVRELNISSFMALSRCAGRNIREKLAGNPYLQSVRRFQSVDLLENRLLKAFSERLLELLELRVECLDEKPDELMTQIKSWLVSDEAKSISKWNNLPPNNTLLSHRNYRAIYDSWRWLQSLDVDIDRDFSNINERQTTMQNWRKYAEMYNTHLFAEMPVLFDYDNFGIQLWTGELIFDNKEKFIDRPCTPPEIECPVCIDLTEVYPKYACANGSNIKKFLYEEKTYPKPFIWQSWKHDRESVDIELFDADAVYLYSDAITISVPDLFFATKEKESYLDKAAFSFARQLRKTLKNDTLVWLYPDSINDFEIKIIRRNLNGCFPNAEPLPRSVAAMFENIDYTKYKLRKGFSVVVVDLIGGIECATKLQANYDENLKEALPLTKGFYWERQPSVVLSRNRDKIKDHQSLSELTVVSSQGRWIDAEPSIQPQFISNDILCKDKRFGKIDLIINISKSPIAGGIKLYNMQRNIEFPLWCDHIQEFSIKVRKNGRLQRVCLVDEKNSTVRPIRGKKIEIPIADTFILPKGKKFYSLPIYIGKNDEELGFSARLDSPQFPFKQDTNCKLSLTYDYGSDEPYKLTFIPCDRNLQPVNASWQRTKVENITDAPAPKYPKVMTWEDLKSVLNPNTGGSRDMLKWVLHAMSGPSRKTGKIYHDWKQDRNGKSFTHAESDGNRVFIHQDYFITGYSCSKYRKYDEISFVERKGYEGKIIGTSIADKDYNYKLDINVIRKRMYVPFIITWGDGRSISDPECPKDFASNVIPEIKEINSLLDKDLPKKIKDAYRFILSCLHKDTTDECIDWISKICRDPNRNKYYAMHVGFALGGVSEDWQMKILKYLLENIDEFTIYVFSYAIWREKHFVDKFTISELNKILNRLLEVLKNVKYRSGTDDVNFLLTRALELLLGLLRTRDSTNEEIKMLLQPHQKITKDFSREIDYIANIAEENNLFLFSRIELDMKKPCDDKTPDLLYALRLYLDNEDDANAITINSISENPFEK